MLQDKLAIGDFQHIIAIKLCLLVFLVLGIVTIWKCKKFRPLAFLSVAGALSAVAYYLLVHRLGLMFWGLKGDEVTIAAMYEMFAHHSFFSDFAYANLPPFYPPLFFWIFAVVGRALNWNGIMIAKLGTFSAILFLPIFSYLAQKFYWRRQNDTQSNTFNPGTIAWFVSPFLFFVLLDWDAIIIKPYEALVAIGVCLWAAFLYNDLQKEKWNYKYFLLYGFFGGLLFMAYYLWLIFGVLGLFFLFLFVTKKDQWKYLGRLIGIGILTLLFASPFLLPLVISYQKFGTENWQTAPVYLNGLTWKLPMFDWTWRGAAMLFGLVSLLVYRKIPYVRALLSLFITVYVWYFLGLGTILFFMSPIQEFKGFEFFLNIVLGFGAAYGLERAWLSLGKFTFFTANKKVLLTIALLLVSTKMIFGSFTDDPVVQERRVESRSPRKTILDLAAFLQKDKSMANVLTLHSGIYDLSAFTPVNSFLYFNQNNSHPAAGFSARKAYLAFLAGARSSDEFDALASSSPYGAIERFIFIKNSDKDNYLIYLYVDNFPHGFKNEIIKIPKKLISEKNFAKVYENSGFVVWQIKK